MGAGTSNLKGLSVQEVLELIGEYFHSRNFTVENSFAFLDKDESGELDWEEFLLGFRLCTQGMGVDDDYPPEVLKPIFALFDTNQDGHLSIAEYVQAFTPKTGYGSSYYDYEFYSRSRPTPGCPSFGASGHLSRTERERRFQEELIMRVSASMNRLGKSSYELFEEVDKDGSGTLTREELKALCLSIQPDLSRTELGVIFSHFDRDGSDTVSKDEFCASLEGANGSALFQVEKCIRAISERFVRKGHTVHDAFFVFDRDGDGFLTRDEWRRALSLFGDGDAEKGHPEFVFQRFDLDKTGRLSISELERFFCESIARARVVQSWSSDAPGSLSLSQLPQIPEEEPWETEILDAIRDRLATHKIMRCELDLPTIFQRINVSRTGSLTIDEFGALVSSCCSRLRQDALQQLFGKLDINGVNGIQYGEFVRRLG